MMSTVLRWLRGPRHVPSYYITRRLFLRALGLTYLAAFVSLAVQVEGLIGSNGISPVSEFLEAVRRQTGNERYWSVPTLAWLAHGDAVLQSACWLGALLSLAVVFGLAPGPMLVVLWALYLSFCSISAPFLNFQWDILLLETGLLAILFAPWRLRTGLQREAPPSRPALWLLRFLLFKLMLLSGAVKLLSRDPTWWELQALDYHYFTQPLPTWIGWYAHQLPQWFQQASVAVMFFIELVLPFLIFGPRRLRLCAFWGLVWLQVVIALTGNYTFFNWLTFTLCLTLLDDAAWYRLLPRRLLRGWCQPRQRRRFRLRALPLAAVAAAITVLSAAEMVDRLWPRNQVTARLRPVQRRLGPFRCINAYGLFARMTTTRSEIIFEGSHDGRTWLAYEFKWKPGDLARRPGFVAPHQPRLDWQMWFAALSNYRRQPWLVRFAQRLLEGSPEVLALLEHNPFPDGPPRYIRALVYPYAFTDRAHRRDTGQWWRRDAPRLYLPAMAFKRER